MVSVGDENPTIVVAGRTPHASAESQKEYRLARFIRNCSRTYTTSSTLSIRLCTLTLFHSRFRTKMRSTMQKNVASVWCPSFCIFQDPIMSHKCMSKTAVKTSKDTHKSAAELGTP